MRFFTLIGTLVFPFLLWAGPLEASDIQSKALYVELRQNGGGAQREIAIRVRDKNSGTTARLILQAVPKETGVYAGSFVIEFIRGDNRSKTFEFILADKPLYIFSSQNKMVQTVQLFAEAKDWSRYVEQFKSTQSKPGGATGTVQQQQVQIRMEDQVQEEVRMQVEEAMVVKRNQMMEKQAAMSAAERQKKVDQAKELLVQAQALYVKGNYPEAEKLFAKATELDPSNDTSYFQYGVTLYKNESYNKSLAVLSMAEGSAPNENERAYYVALDHMKLHEYEQAEKTFVEIRDENDPQLSPVASFFAGNIQFQTQKYAEARKSFEFVLDNSKDPQMDKSAESMIEDISRIENFLAASKEKFKLTANFGLVNDSNVLGVAIPNSTTNANAYRANYGFTATAYTYRTPNSDFSVMGLLNDYYSVDKDFKNSATLQSTDALDMELSAPWHSQFTLGGQGYNYEVTPLYRSVWLALAGKSTRQEAISTAAVTTGFTTALTPTWLIHPKVEFGNDESYLSNAETVATADDQKGNHSTLSLSQTWLMDLKGTRSWTLDLSYTNTNTQGDNYKATKPALGVTYAFPAPWQSNGSVRLDYSAADYAKASAPRTDKVSLLTLSDTKELKSSLSLTTMLQYTDSRSDVTTYTYNKYLISGTLTYTLHVLDK